jgi:hypothetical protein
MREAAEGKLKSVDRDIASERQVRIIFPISHTNTHVTGDGRE